MPGENFDPSNHTSLDEPIFVLRDSLGVLAVQILAAKRDLSSMPYYDALNELLDIIEELQSAYDCMN
jgi:hypothetical protein